MREISRRSFWDGDGITYQVLVDGKVVLSAYTAEECDEFIEKLESGEEVRHGE